MNLTTDELEHIYEALSLSIEGVKHLEVSPPYRKQIEAELCLLLKKIADEVEHRAQTSTSK